MGLSVASSRHIIRGFASLNVTEASGVQKADQPRDLELGFFSNKLEFAEWVYGTVDELPIGEVSAIGWEAAKCVEKIVPTPRLFSELEHSVKHYCVCPWKHAH